jgi:acyl-coenzyme A thioesterase PaaI-like protein
MEGFLSLPPPLSIPEAERRQGIERAGSGTDRRGPACFIVDIAAVAASWSLLPRRQGARGSTIGMQVSYPSAAATAVVADAHVQQRSEELLFSTVHVTSAVSGQLVAMGQVTYRLLEPWPEG